MAAARVANAHRFVLAKPDGYDNLVGERGEKLSGGEKQRIAIARTVLLSPRILILDEATSSLDVETEASIQEALVRLARNRTTFIVAHRLSTVRHAARLIVVEDGNIVETGSFSELMKRRGKFHNLAAAQGLADSTISPRTLPQIGEPTMMFDPKQIRLSRDVSLMLHLTLGGVDTYEQVRLVRAAPLSDPGHYISILDSVGKEICMIRDPLELDELSRQIVFGELQWRYITTVIQKIHSVHTDAGMSYFKVETDRGHRDFLVHHTEENIRWLSERRLFLVDEDGNRFELPDVSALDRKSEKSLIVLR
jgi:Domain of unknown function (DUF1854)/ABC transporter